MILKPYEKLASVYDSEWGNFSLVYVTIIETLKTDLNIDFKTVLDIACGTGMLVNALSASCDVVGCDLSPAMIAIARKNYPAIEFHDADMATVDPQKKFDLILCPFDSINYLIDDRQLYRAIKNIRALLYDGGYFLFDFNTHAMYRDKHAGIIERQDGTIRFTQILEYDKKNRIAKTTFDFGDGCKELHVQKGFYFEEISGLLAANGFAILHTSDMLKKTGTIDEQSYKIVLLARKTDG